MAYGYGTPLSGLAGDAAQVARQIQAMRASNQAMGLAGLQEARQADEYAYEQRMRPILEQRAAKEWQDQQAELARVTQERTRQETARRRLGTLPLSAGMRGSSMYSPEGLEAQRQELMFQAYPDKALEYVVPKPKEYTPSVHTQAGVPGAWVTDTSGKTSFQPLPEGTEIKPKKVQTVVGENGLMTLWDDGNVTFDPTPDEFRPKQPANTFGRGSVQMQTFLLGKGYNLKNPDEAKKAYEWFGTPAGQQEWLSYVDKMAAASYNPPPPTWGAIGVDASGVPLVYNTKNPSQVATVGGGRVSGPPQPFIPRPTNLPPADVTNLTTLTNLSSRLRDLVKTAQQNPQWVGPLQGRTTKLGGKFFNLPAYKSFRQKWETLREAVYGFSGKQINEQEQQWLKEVFPKLEDPDQNFVASGLSAANWLENKANLTRQSLQQSGRHLNIAGQGSPAPAPPKTGAKPDPLGLR